MTTGAQAERVSGGLGREDELRLAELARSGDRAARNRLVEANLGFVVTIAREYRNRGLSQEDLLHEGSLGLIEAAQRFEVERGTRFTTCAAWWVRKAMLLALEKQASLLRVSGSLWRLAREAATAERELARELGRAPDRDELSRHMNRDRASLERALDSRPREVALDHPRCAGTPGTLAERLPTPRKAQPLDELLLAEAQALLNQALARLEPMERDVLHQRFGLGGDRPVPLREVGGKLGVTGERVRQIESRAVGRLRKMMQERYAPKQHRRGPPGLGPRLPTVVRAPLRHDPPRPIREPRPEREPRPVLDDRIPQCTR